MKNDNAIIKSAARGMISPFVDHLVCKDNERPVISYGLSSFGYDIRLSDAEFKVFRHIPGTVADPKNFNQANLENVDLHEDKSGKYFILPAHSYGLGVALEYLDIPRNTTGICLGKSTYARAGIIANITPAESGWKGHLTLEFSNSSSTDCRMYANEGIAQLLFFEGDPCITSYADRKGKYQNQTLRVTPAKAGTQDTAEPQVLRRSKGAT